MEKVMKVSIRENLWSAELLAEHWGVSKHTLERWRINGVGPSYLKIGGQIRYRLKEILDFENQRLFNSPAGIAPVDWRIDAATRTQQMFSRRR
jgi:hypothetical protein